MVLMIDSTQHYHCSDRHTNCVIFSLNINLPVNFLIKLLIVLVKMSENSENCLIKIF